MSDIHPKIKDEMVSLVIVIGQSGSGHSTALNCLEDAGFSAVDNLPLALVDQLVGLVVETEKKQLAIGVDLRTSGFDLDAIARLVENLKDRLQDRCQIVLTRAKRAELVRRYQATRRRHPLQDSYGDLAEAIEADKQLVTQISHLADIEIDSTDYSPAEFCSALLAGLGIANEQAAPLTIMSFSYRRGLPQGADFIFDTRFLSNPHWQAKLRDKTGLDEDVQDFIMMDEHFLPYMQRVAKILEGIFPRLRQDGRAQVVIGFGCTGGRHRSVTAALWFAKWAKAEEIETLVLHRELR